MAYGQGMDPVHGVMKAASTVKGPGKILYADQSDNALLLSADGKFPLGISAGESSRTDGTLDATGATVSYYPLGGVLMVQSAASQTYKPGMIVYAGADGLALDSQDNSEKKLGIYVGKVMSSATAALALNGAGDSGATEGQMVLVNTAFAEAGHNA
jgi:hypothetical protein